jgi:hypothetical protein
MSPVAKPFRFPSRIGRLVLLVALAAGASPRAESAPATVKETKKVNLQVKDLGGISRSVPVKEKKATVLVFIAHDCPISNAYAPEISRIGNEYSKRGVQMMVVYAEGQVSAATARQHAKQFGYQVPLVIDATRRLSGATGATVTPEAVVLGPDGRSLYRGRIDNRYAGFGKSRKTATERDLRVALDAVLAGQPVPNPTTTAVGCFIPPAA